MSRLPLILGGLVAGAVGAVLVIRSCEPTAVAVVVPPSQPLPSPVALPPPLTAVPRPSPLVIEVTPVEPTPARLSPKSEKALFLAKPDREVIENIIGRDGDDLRSRLSKFQKRDRLLEPAGDYQERRPTTKRGQAGGGGGLP